MNEEVKEKNNQITDSLRYALTIEESILPPNSWFQQQFSDFFILFKPKDIVSGDFYWAHHEGSKKIIAAVDCTGHGVPGAFMSMVGNSLLNQAVKENKTYNPAEILTFINRQIKDLFKQETTETSEGMDLCICVIDDLGNNQHQLTFAGAKRPLYYILPNSNELESLKADRISIGWPYKKKQQGNLFHNQQITVEKGTQLFFTTDGYADNHGLVKPKIGSAKMKKVFLKNAHLPMEEQKQCLLDMLLTEQGDKEQRDDITLISVKL